MSKKNKRRGDIGIYKPNKNKTGSVAQFKLSNNDDCMFLEVAKQVRPMDDSKPYDWETKIIVKLGETDICKFLAYLNLSAPGAPLKIFHQSPGGGSKSIEFKYQEYNGRPSYYMTVGAGKDNRVSVPIGLDEVEYLKIGFKKALEVILGWDRTAGD